MSAPFHIFKERECRNCRGTGEVPYIPLYLPDFVEAEDAEPCPDCCGTGVEQDSAEDLT